MAISGQLIVNDYGLFCEIIKRKYHTGQYLFTVILSILTSLIIFKRH